MNYETLDEITLVIRNGLSIKQGKEVDGLPITRIETISDGIIDENKVGYAGLQQGDEDKHVLQNGDILFSHINSDEHIGKTAFYNGFPSPLIHGMNLLKLRPDKEKVYSKYLYYALNHPLFRKVILAKSNRSVNQSSISITKLKKLEIPLPPLETQKKIADILDKADTLRQKRRQTIEKLDELTQSVFLDMFGDPGSNPQGWPLKKFKDVFNSIRYGTGSPPDYKKKGIPFIRATNIKSGQIVKNDLKYISAEGAETIQKCKLNVGNLLIVRSGVNSGECAKITEEYKDAYAGYDLIIEIEDPYSTFYNHLINSEYGKKVIKLLSRRSGQPHLNATQVKNLEFYLPPQKMLKEFQNKFGSIENHKFKCKEHLVVLDNLFNSLLQKAFKGELNFNGEEQLLAAEAGQEYGV